MGLETHDTPVDLGDDKILTEDEVAVIFHTNKKNLEKWRYQGKGPPWLAAGGKGGKVGYRLGDLRASIRANRHDITTA